MSFDIVRSEPISRQVYWQLRERLLTGKISPDTPLVEDKIAKELNVSRTPVREAILLLEADHLVRVLANGRTVTIDVLSELEDILGVREALECYAARRALDHITDSEIARLEAICEEAERTPLSQVEQRSDLNREFHETIVRAARNRRLGTAIEDYRGYFAVAHQVYDAKMVEASCAEHRMMVDAIRHKKADELESIIRRHLHRAARTIRRQLAKRSSSEVDNRGGNLS